MAAGFDVRVLGVDELAAGSKTLAGNIEQAAGPAIARAANDPAEQVRGDVPRLTGALAGSVAVQARPDGASLSMGDGVVYAQYVEFGGRGHPHSAEGNYLYPAAQAAEPLIVQAAEQAANSEIGSMRWPTPG